MKNVVKWFQDNTSCPLCRSNITLVDNVIPILTSDVERYVVIKYIELLILINYDN